MTAFFEQVNTDHPADAVLLAFDSGHMTDPVLELRIAEHLGLCDSCDSRLHDLTVTEDAIIKLLRERDPFESFADEHGNLPIAVRQYAPKLPVATTRTFLSHEQDTGSEMGNPGRSPIVDPDPLPRKIGKYFILERIGEGGYGTVYEANDPDRHCSVAIKVLRDDRAKGLLGEARIITKLRHPSIVKVYDVDQCNDGWFLVMEYMPGGSLRDLLRVERISHERAAGIVVEIAQALHYAHTRKDPIYHRDVKPENILLDEQGRPYLTDFGLAIREGKRWDHEGERAGTRKYMSPEQASGKAQFIDGRTDVWSLGVVFYEMLAGQKPFDRESRTELFNDIQHREPRPPSTINPTVPKPLEVICLKCLAKNVSDRFATAADLAGAVRECTTVPQSGRQHLQGKIRPAQTWPRKAILPVIGLVCMAVVVFATLVLVFRPEPIVVGKPYQLLDKVPIVVFPHDQAQTIADTRREVLHVLPAEEGAICLCQLGITSAADFELKARIDNLSDTGEAGVYWGYRGSADGKDKWAFEGVRLVFRRAGSARSCFVTRELIEITEDKILRIPDASRTGLTVPAAIARGTEGYDIVIRFNGNQVISATINGQSHDELCDRVISDPRVPGDATGGYGVFAEDSTVRFSHAYFTQLLEYEK